MKKVSAIFCGMIRFVRLYFVLAGMILLFAQCGKDTVDPDEDDPNPPVEEIKPGPGMDLYGLVLDDQGQPVKNLVVSDGFSCTVTDQDGIYQMKRNAEADFVFYSTPSAYEVNTASASVRMASFYASLSASKQRYDFSLKRLSAVETNFTLVCVGDPQVTSTAEVDRFRTETMADIRTFAESSAKPCYGLVMGDMAGDKPAFFDQMKALVGSANMKVFTTIGNHDKVATSNSGEPRTTDAFTKVYGPVNYSFNRGDVHFICLDNIVFTNASDYSGGFTTSQIEWLKKDLSYVSKNKMIIVYYHIPIRNSSGISNRTQLLSALQGYTEVHLMCGHTHYAENVKITSPVAAYEHIHAAACGSWWRSTINGDGTPNGYAVYEVSGTKITNGYYKPTRLSKDFQIRLHKGNVVFGGEYGYFTFNQADNAIVANIWNADSDWKVEAWENNVKVADLASLPTSLKDAWTLGYHIGVLNRNPDNYSPACKHLYLHTMINPAASLEIRATDRFGNIYKQSEITADFTTATSYSYLN